MSGRSFDGRVIFDHLAKTGGQAINAWLVKRLGGGCVTPNLAGNHRDLIRRYGGDYSIISAHVAFAGEGFDPRYKYATCVRHPVSRSLSWLGYLLQQSRAAAPVLVEAAERFVGTRGQGEYPAVFVDSICNSVTRHFASVVASVPLSDKETLEAALDVIGKYHVWGLYERFSDFAVDFANLLRIEPPERIARVNRTRYDTRIVSAMSGLAGALEALNAVDLAFYRELEARWHGEHGNREASAVRRQLDWAPYEGARSGNRSGADFTLVAAMLEGEKEGPAGRAVSFKVDFSLAIDVEELEVGLHIIDEDGIWAFGSNTTRLKRELRDIHSGTHTVRFYVFCDLPVGRYTAGFSFCALGNNAQIELAWYDGLVEFVVINHASSQSIGYACLPVEVELAWNNARFVRTVRDGAGVMEIDGLLGSLSIAERVAVPVRVTNLSRESWVATPVAPIDLSYRWIDSCGQIEVAEGERSPLTLSEIESGATVSATMKVTAPDVAGRYRLVLTVIQGQDCWLDSCGFRATEIEVEVIAGESPRWYGVGNVRLKTQVGRVEGERIVSNKRAGFLVFGPYARMPAGRHLITVEGGCSGASGMVRTEIVVGGGRKVLKTSGQEQEEVADAVCRMVVDLEEIVEDLEVRLWVAADATVEVKGVRIEPLARALSLG